MARDSAEGRKIVASNRRARHEYEVLERMEAGIALTGAEVKSLRAGKVSIAGAFARLDNGEVWLHDMHISPYEAAGRWNTDPLRPRKLLLHRQEIRKLIGGVQEKGRTLVPLEIYFKRGRAKVDLAVARGKKLHDKRQDQKTQEAKREVERALRGGR
ncbi:MAG TPA: SsrA-binding protein SmpB [Longimicrobiales bacterium]|nr:SsrA-binding protein SmpB [Longimicrobiales bacterium]